jgi:S-adenosylmethionine decarboxylase
LHKGKHLLIDCRDVPYAQCLDDQILLDVMSRSARLAGSTVISQIRYKFGNDSPPGCTAVVMLDESHCSVHTYAELGLMAFDIFTCGTTDPMRIWEMIREELNIRTADVRQVDRFLMTGHMSQGMAS